MLSPAAAKAAERREIRTAKPKRGYLKYSEAVRRSKFTPYIPATPYPSSNSLGPIRKSLAFRKAIFLFCERWKFIFSKRTKTKKRLKGNFNRFRNLVGAEGLTSLCSAAASHRSFFPLGEAAKQKYTKSIPLINILFAAISRANQFAETCSK